MQGVFFFSLFSHIYSSDQRYLYGLNFVSKEEQASFASSLSTIINDLSNQPSGSEETNSTHAEDIETVEETETATTEATTPTATLPATSTTAATTAAAPVTTPTATTVTTAAVTTTAATGHQRKSSANDSSQLSSVDSNQRETEKKEPEKKGTATPALMNDLSAKLAKRANVVFKRFCICNTDLSLLKGK